MTDWWVVRAFESSVLCVFVGRPYWTTKNPKGFKRSLNERGCTSVNLLLNALAWIGLLRATGSVLGNLVRKLKLQRLKESDLMD